MPKFNKGDIVAPIHLPRCYYMIIETDINLLDMDDNFCHAYALIERITTDHFISQTDEYWTVISSILRESASLSDASKELS